jgi:hypothetical protein
VVLYSGDSLLVPKKFLCYKNRVVRLMTEHGIRSSCGELFKQLRILLLESQYILSFMLFVQKNTIFLL